jgi:hypothetical protein
MKGGQLARFYTVKSVANKRVTNRRGREMKIKWTRLDSLFTRGQSSRTVF